MLFWWDVPLLRYGTCGSVVKIEQNKSVVEQDHCQPMILIEGKLRMGKKQHIKYMGCVAARCANGDLV